MNKIDPVTTVSPHPAGLKQRQILLMAAATGVAVGSQYYNQPLLGLMAKDFGSPAGVVATATQAGYALGLIFLVPLGDKFERRTLILLQSLGLVIAMLAACFSSGLYSLACASVLIGVFATIAQQMIPLAAELTSANRRETALATLTSGLLAGVLLSRAISGLIGQEYGWRSVFLFGATLTVLMMICLVFRLPRSVPDTRLSYRGLLRSLWVLIGDQPVLRRATIIQSLLFFGFSAFWTTLALLLESPRFGFSSGVAGMFGVVALAGALPAPFIMRRLSTPQNPEKAIRMGVYLVAAGFLLMSHWITLITLTSGVILMTCGLQISLIKLQSVVLGAAGSARGSFNTVFMASQFAFGAAGSAAAGIAWACGGWTLVMIMSTATSLLAVIIQHFRPITAR